jgi:hypothetical protein
MDRVHRDLNALELFDPETHGDAIYYLHEPGSTPHRHAIVR